MIIRICKDGGMVAVSASQVTIKILRVTKVLTHGRKMSIIVLRIRNSRWLIGFLVLYELDVIASHPHITGG